MPFRFQLSVFAIRSLGAIISPLVAASCRPSAISARIVFLLRLIFASLYFQPCHFFAALLRQPQIVLYLRATPDSLSAFIIISDIFTFDFAIFISDFVFFHYFHFRLRHFTPPLSQSFLFDTPSIIRQLFCALPFIDLRRADISSCFQLRQRVSAMPRFFAFISINIFDFDTPFDYFHFHLSSLLRFQIHLSFPFLDVFIICSFHFLFSLFRFFEPQAGLLPHFLRFLDITFIRFLFSISLRHIIDISRR